MIISIEKCQSDGALNVRWSSGDPQPTIVTYYLSVMPTNFVLKLQLKGIFKHKG